jgi:uncharacterized protein YhfF
MRAVGLSEPGQFRDDFNAQVLAGKKTATAGLWRIDYEPDGEPIEEVSERFVFLDSDDQRLALAEITRVESHPFASVPWELARDEGERFESTADFRAGYRRYYDKRGTMIADDDLAVCVWFELVATA